ncbi:hypothetical protein CERSUDRAFT_110918 [Gelatoporia subvermispora B]|uniref:Nudix hydrolase domain-containing protein n=1 Tax=Ceriporiopsis subvermispora (strain B) TaxID=914234 RepID=M2R7A2_CERS8|nr:hypothetical protein CERSUDRAFT_110918 [Gelatoporia subvermispora B]
MASRPRRSSLLKFHRPKLSLDNAPIPPLKPESRQCLQNLLAYRPPKQNLIFPKARSAGVLVALFVGRMGDLYVLLSRRAATLRTYAGDTSLPGGKWEQGDRNLEYTARREAFEEIGLPNDPRKAPLLCVMEPFLSGNMTVVTPVVVLIVDNTLRPILNAPEVASLFSHPLKSFLHEQPPFPTELDMIEQPEQPYHTFVDINWHNQGKLRMHRFLTGREAGGTKPIFGLTASILIRAATIGYGREPDYELNAPGQPSLPERLAYALRNHPVLREAALKEGIDPDRSPERPSQRKPSTGDRRRPRLRRAGSRVRSRL